MSRNIVISLLTAVTLQAGLWGIGLAETSDRKQVDVLAMPAFQEAAKNWSAEATFEMAALVHIRLGQYEEAAALLEALVRRRPNVSGLWNVLAMAYNRSGQSEKAWEAANIAVTLEPYIDAYYFERGLAAFQSGRNQDALADLDRYVAAFTTSAKGRFYRGMAYARLDNRPAARRELARAGDLNPYLLLLTDYTIGLLDAESGRLAEAISALNETLVAFDGILHPARNQIAGQLLRMMAADYVRKDPVRSPALEALMKEDIRHAAKHFPRLDVAAR